jgi:hypothetical protein
MTEQAFVALVCQAWREGFKLVHLASEMQSVNGTSWGEGSMWTARVRSPATGASYVLHFIRANSVFAPEDGGWLAKYRRALPLLRTATVAIFGLGFNVAKAVSTAERLEQQVRMLNQLRGRRPSVFLEYAATHFPANASAGRCAATWWPEEENAAAAQRLNAALMHLVEAKVVGRIAPLFNLTRNRGDAHIGALTGVSHAGLATLKRRGVIAAFKRGLDCGHYCVQGGLLEAHALAVLRAIEMPEHWMGTDSATVMDPAEKAAAQVPPSPAPRLPSNGSHTTIHGTMEHGT